MIYTGSIVILGTFNKFFNVTDDCQTQVLGVPTASITVMMNYIKAWYENEYGGSFVWAYNQNTLTVNVIFKPDTDPVNTPCGELEKISFGSVGVYDMILTRANPCDTCQEIVLENCTEGQLIFPNGIPSGPNFTIYDHQSGVTYTQFTESGGWDLTNSTGIFTPFSVYTLTITDENGQPVSWADGDKEYTCARITFTNTIDTNVVT